MTAQRVRPLINRRATLAGAGALALAAALTAGTSAQAAVGPARMSPATNPTCTLTPLTPMILHGSPNSVEGIASITCTAAMPQINIEVLLYENGSLVNYSYTTVVNQTTAVWVTTAPDSRGLYQTAAYGSVVFPAGSSPSSENLPLAFSSSVLLN